MRTIHKVALSGAATVAGLVGAETLRRRGHREITTWDSSPEVAIYSVNNRHTDRLVVVYVGAFNDADHVTGMKNLYLGTEDVRRHRENNFMGTLLEFADVMIVKYDQLAFDMNVCAQKTYDEIQHNPLYQQYKQFVLLGGSMGFIGVLRLYLMANKDGLMHPGNTVVVPADPAQCAGHLPWAARFARFVRPGPVLNRLTPIVGRLMFRVTPETTWSPGTNKDVVKAHVTAMQQHRLSVILPMIATIADNTPVPPEQLVGLRAAALFSGTDPVIDGPASQATLHQQFGDNLVIIPVSDGNHVDWVEHAPAWCEGLRKAFAALGVQALEG